MLYLLERMTVLSDMTLENKGQKNDNICEYKSQKIVF